jgi:hypothetical protein
MIQTAEVRSCNDDITDTSESPLVTSRPAKSCSAFFLWNNRQAGAARLEEYSMTEK